MAHIFKQLSRSAVGLLALTSAALAGCAPSPYYTDPDYTEHNRPRTVIVREPAQPPRAVLVRDHDRPPPDEHRKPSDEHREHRGDIQRPRTGERRQQQGSTESRQRRRPSSEE